MTPVMTSVRVNPSPTLLSTVRTPPPPKKKQKKKLYTGMYIFFTVGQTFDTICNTERHNYHCFPCNCRVT